MTTCICRGLRGGQGSDGILSPTTIEDIELFRGGDNRTVILSMNINMTDGTTPSTIIIGPVEISSCCVPPVRYEVAYDTDNSEFLSSLNAPQLEITSGTNDVEIEGSTNGYCFMMETDIRRLTATPNPDTISASYNRLGTGSSPQLFGTVILPIPSQFGILLNKTIPTSSFTTWDISPSTGQGTKDVFFTNLSNRRYGGFRRVETVPVEDPSSFTFNDNINPLISLDPPVLPPPTPITSYLQSYSRFVEQEIYFTGNGTADIKITSNGIEEVNESNTAIDQNLYRLNRYVLNAGEELIPTIIDITPTPGVDSRLFYFIFIYTCSE